MKKILAILIAAIAGLAVLYFGGKYFTKSFNTSPTTTFNETGNFNRNDITFNYQTNFDDQQVETDANSGIAPEITPELMTVNIPLVADTGIVFRQYLVPESPAVLNAVYTRLFDLDANPVQNESISNVVANSGLSYDSVSLSRGVVVLNLSGQYLRMHLGDFSFRQQINATAFQYSTVNSIEVFLNGNRFDWCDVSDADPSESGCDTTPRFWIDSK